MDIYVQKHGEKLGPFLETKIREGIDAGAFGPDDLAWTSGKASWQPLSALINLDVNLPPPVNGDHAPAFLPTASIGAMTSDSESKPVDEHRPVFVPASVAAQTSDPILYEEPSDFREHMDYLKGKITTTPRVLVTPGRLKVGSSSYSLHEVLEAKLDITSELSGYAEFFNSKRLHQLAVWSVYGSVMGCVITWYALLLLAVAIVLYFAAQSAMTREALGQRWCAKIALSWPNRREEIFIGAFRPYPDEPLADIIRRRIPHSPNEVASWREEFNQNKRRSHDIVEAVGKAIEGKSKLM